MRIFISGGCKNGKSLYAQHLASSMKRANAPLYYLATMISKDAEDTLRIARHREERLGFGFNTVEIPTDIINVLSLCDTRGSFLLDSTTALLDNEMFANGLKADAYKKISQELICVIAELKDIVIVSDYIYSDALFYGESVEDYKRGLAYIDRTLASVCDVVLESCFGMITAYKGQQMWMNFFNLLKERTDLR